MRLTLSYKSSADLAAHLDQQRSQGAVLVPMGEPERVEQYQPVTLAVSLPDGTGGEVEAEVLQVIPNLGLAVSLKDPSAAFAIAGGAKPAEEPSPPEVSAADAPEGPAPVKGSGLPKGTSPISWPIEKLQAEWGDLPLPDRIRVARHGKRPARAFVMRQMDSQLNNFLVSNPHITAEEIATLAGMGNLDPALLKRLVASHDWTRHTSVARNLICHPKATLPQVTKLLDKLPEGELRRLTRTGKVRASVKRIIQRKLEKARRR